MDSRELLEILNQINIVGSTASKILDNKVKWENSTKMADYTQFLQDEANQKKNAFQLNKENAKTNLVNSANNVKVAYKKNRLWGATQQKISDKVNEEFQSDDIQSVMDNHNLTLNDNLTISVGNVDNAMQQLKNYSIGAEMQEKVAGILGGLNREFEGLSDEYAKINANLAPQGVANVVDALDIEAHITSKPEMFRESKFDLGIVPEDERGKVPFLPGDENIYADVLRQEKRNEGGIDYGYATPSKELDASFNAITSAGDKDYNKRVEQAFQSIKQSEELLDNDDKFNIASGGSTHSLKGTQALYSNNDESENLRDNLQSQILKGMNFGADNQGSFEDSDIGKLVRASIGKSGDSETKIMRAIYKKVVSDEPNKEIYGYGNKMWADEDMELIDLATGGKNKVRQQVSEDILKKRIIFWGMLDKRLNPEQYK